MASIRRLLRIPAKVIRKLKKGPSPSAPEATRACCQVGESIEQRDLVILTPDIVGEVRIGLGMRHWEIAKALAARGADVTLATPHSFPDALAGEGFGLHHLTSEA